MKFRFYLDELVKQHETQSDLVAKLEDQEKKNKEEKKKIKDAFNTLLRDEWYLDELVKKHKTQSDLVAELGDQEKKNKEEKKKIKEAKMELLKIKKAILAKKRDHKIQSDLVAELGGQETLSDLVAELKDQGKKIKEAKMELLKIKKAISAKKRDHKYATLSTEQQRILMKKYQKTLHSAALIPINPLDPPQSKKVDDNKVKKILWNFATYFFSLSPGSRKHELMKLLNNNKPTIYSPLHGEDHFIFPRKQQLRDPRQRTLQQPHLTSLLVAQPMKNGKIVKVNRKLPPSNKDFVYLLNHLPNDLLRQIFFFLSREDIPESVELDMTKLPLVLNLNKRFLDDDWEERR